MLPYNQLTSKMVRYKLLIVTLYYILNAIVQVPTADKMVLSTCVRRMSESIEKRFCFDIQVEGKQTTYTFQALSEDDRKAWMDIMDGREPVNTYIF